jgi:hypothetical protein
MRLPAPPRDARVAAAATSANDAGSLWSLLSGRTGAEPRGKQGPPGRGLAGG